MNVRNLVPWTRGERERSVAQPADVNPVLNLHRQVNRLFDDMFQDFAAPQLWSSHATWPSVDVQETDKEYRVTADIPGLDGRDVEVLFHEGVLTLRGEKRTEKESENRTIRERFYGRFERQVALDRDVDEGNIHATFRNGTLIVTIPKSAQALEKAKRIPVSVEGKSH